MMLHGIMIRVAFLLVFIFATSLSILNAQNEPIPANVKWVANQVMKSLLEDISHYKGQYSELNAFDERSVTKNSQDLPRLSYTSPDASGIDYVLSVEFLPVDEHVVVPDGMELKAWRFPLLGIKLTRLFDYKRRGYPLDIDRMINAHVRTLLKFEQTLMPLQITIKPEKDLYRIGERIQFQIILSNKGSQNLKVKSLDDRTLYFSFGNRFWGTPPKDAQGGSLEILAPGKFLTKSFKGESFSLPQEVEIMATYAIGYKGVYPIDWVKVRIAE